MDLVDGRRPTDIQYNRRSDAEKSEIIGEQEEKGRGIDEALEGIDEAQP